MLASLRNLDYPPDKVKLTFAVTCIKGHGESVAYRDKLKMLLVSANMPYETTVIETWPTPEEFQRWGPYFGVICNLHALRLDFLRQTEYQYFWLLGGDNPPPRNTLKKLTRTRGDVVSAVINQRPLKSDSGKAIPVVWSRHWMLHDIPHGLEPELREELRTAWREFAFLKQVTLPKSRQVLHHMSFGSGCSLISREVLEYSGYVLGYGATHSEDLHFCQNLELLGFDAKVNLDAGCMHFDSDGKVY
jgi:hypothetical protein